jgi:hypothetical protein
MNNSLALALCTALTLIFASLAAAHQSEFPGVERAMSPQTFEAAGLNKLSPEERARLDEFIRGYVATSSEKAATAAVDEAAKSGKVRRNEPEIIQSALVGRFTGYTGRSTFTLENGQVYKQSQQVSRSFPPVDSPPVIVVKGTGMLSGYRMYIAGGGNIRVVRLK